MQSNRLPLALAVARVKKDRQIDDLKGHGFRACRKIVGTGKECQGTTLVVPPKGQHDLWALAPERFSVNNLRISSG
jgi:hypothetical protein